MVTEARSVNSVLVVPMSHHRTVRGAATDAVIM